MMRLTAKQLSEIKKFAERSMSRNDKWHNIFHINETVRLSKILAKKENADLNKCVVIAWLHDICKHHEADKKDHGKEGSKKAREFLKKLNLNEKDISDICYAINEHNRGGRKRTKEAGIIWDADKLQAVGPYGLLRSYGVCVFEGLDQEEAYRNNLKSQKFFIRRFHTETGKRIAEKNYKLMSVFDKNYSNLRRGKI